MEEELNYVNVTFKTNGGSSHEKKSSSLETVYDEVKTGTLERNVKPPDNKKRVRPAPPHLLVAGLVIVCVVLLSVVVALSTVVSKQRREKDNLTAQKLKLWTEKVELERQTEELRRERDGLNWTVGVILEHEDFPVKTHCPHGVCKPCLDSWVVFQSSCYLFTDSDYSSGWDTWDGSRRNCKEKKADLVVIDSQEEQEFINNHMKYYRDDKHGYWIGLSNKDVMSTWTWVDGSNLSVKYWNTRETRNHKTFCVLSLPKANSPANWQKTSCEMWNRWICETKALIRESKQIP